MKEGQFRQVHWLHDVINVLEPFFLPCHPQYVAFFFFLSLSFFFFFFFNCESKTAAQSQASATDRKKKETSRGKFWCLCQESKHFI